jgi:rhodanese-related sulfurtransferase
MNFVWVCAFADRERKGEKAMEHSPHFLELVNEAKTRVKETNVDDVKQRMDNGEKFLLVDVREDHEWEKGHVPGAVHMGRGVIERDIEVKVPETATKMILYCGGGFRSALVADSLQKMGYTNVESMDGGWRGWVGAGLPTAKD